jgi:hypothetical protein
MQRYPILFLLLPLFSLTTAQAQEFSGGFRAGLNFVTFNGELETAPDGSEFEEFGNSTNFHVGAIANVKFTDIFRLRAELLYSQKGGIIDYDGDSYWLLRPVDGSAPVLATGERVTTLEVTNAYIDIPVMGVAKLGKFELSAGLSAGFLVSSKASGETGFQGTSANGEDIAPFQVALDFNYQKDKEREVDLDNSELREISNQDVAIPEQLNARYQFLDDEENLFNTLDLGFVGGVAYYLNQGLFLGARFNYSLSDITEQSQDISRQEVDADNAYVKRDDDDRNSNLQISVGFSF